MWHLSNFQPKEIIDLALEVEEKGAEFYKKMAGKAKNPEIKEVLLELAAEEEQHQADFKRIGENFGEINPRETYPGEYFDYIKSTVQTHMFADADWMEKLVAAACSEAEIINLAASFEKDSILFFMSFKDMVKGSDEKVITDLIREEEGHLIKLAKIKKEL